MERVLIDSCNFHVNDKVVSIFNPGRVMIVTRVWGDYITCMIGFDDGSEVGFPAKVLKMWNPENNA